MAIEFYKGHATCNDFICFTDADNAHPIDADQVAKLCNRRAGIGADGILRAVKASQLPQWDGDADIWFMDYRNADGSLAEMCGNGLRLFVKYLIEQGLAAGPVAPVATRAGLRSGQLLSDGLVKVGMGIADLGATSWVEYAGQQLAAQPVFVGNPHAVAFLPAQLNLAELDLTHQPGFDKQVFPAGVNIEFVTVTGENSLAMRVFERGVGETMSCGTGVVASAVAYRNQLANQGAQLPQSVQVEVPGGKLRVDFADDQLYLTGPAVFVAHGTSC